MKANPKRMARKLQELIAAWETLRPTKSFAGMTLEQFKAKVGPSLTTREQIVALRDQTVHSRAERRRHDEASSGFASLLVNAIKGDPEEGEDGPLYAALGYVPKSARRSGLTRKGSTTPPAGTAAAN